MKKLLKTLLITLTGLLVVLFVSAGCLQDESQDESLEQIKARVQAEKIRAENCPPEHCAAIGVFLISHEAEFGVLKNLGNIKLIGTIASGKVAYNVSLTNGRVIQFWFAGNRIFIVGEEINGGFIVHYGR